MVFSLHVHGAMPWASIVSIRIHLKREGHLKDMSRLSIIVRIVSNLYWEKVMLPSFSIFYTMVYLLVQKKKIFGYKLHFFLVVCNNEHLPPSPAIINNDPTLSSPPQDEQQEQQQQCSNPILSMVSSTVSSQTKWRYAVCVLYTCVWEIRSLIRSFCVYVSV